MPKSLKIYLFLLVLIFVGIIWADATKDKPIDWSETYSIKDKIPFGMYVLIKNIKSFSHHKRLKNLAKPLMNISISNTTKKIQPIM